MAEYYQQVAYTPYEHSQRETHLGNSMCRMTILTFSMFFPTFGTTGFYQISVSTPQFYPIEVGREWSPPVSTVYLGIFILIGALPLPRICGYWNPEIYPVSDTQLMSQTRFKQISNCDVPVARWWEKLEPLQLPCFSIHQLLTLTASPSIGLRQGYDTSVYGRLAKIGKSQQLEFRRYLAHQLLQCDPLAPKLKLPRLPPAAKHTPVCAINRRLCVPSLQCYH